MLEQLEKQNICDDNDKKIMFENLLGVTIVSIQRLGHGGNSQVYVLEANNSRKYIAKFYFQNPNDQRDRLGVEFSTFKFLRKQGINCVPEPLAINREENCVIYEFIPGSKIVSHEITRDDITEVVQFLSKLKSQRGLAEAKTFPPASEACFSLQAIVQNITMRLKRLEASQNTHESLKNFIQNDFQPFFETLAGWCEQKAQMAQISFDEEIAQNDRTLSPSDYGFHNAIRNENGKINFFDFEYFGWDDPSKMMVDFLWHPAMDISEELKQQFVTDISTVFVENKNLRKRVEIVYPLFGLKWCLIFLNEFIQDDLKRRSFAKQNLTDIQQLQEQQLQKAKNLLNKIKSTFQDFPYKVG